MKNPVISRRADFDLPADEIYLDGAYITPLPRAARRAVEEAYELSSRPYRIKFSDFFDYPDAVRERVAQVLGVPCEEVGITTSCGYGALMLAQGLSLSPGERVLLGSDEFPSSVYPWIALRERGIEVEFIGERGAPLGVDDLRQALARPGQVRLLSVAAVHYLTGNLHPLAELAQLLHEHNALLVTDATQAVGSVAIDWPQTGADAVLMSGYKWLLGPYGCGAAWMRQELLESLSRIGANWWANEKARDLGELLSYAPMSSHGRCLDNGETASFLNLAAFQAGLDYLLAVGVRQVELHHRALQDRLVEGLGDAPVQVLNRLDAPHRSPMLYLQTKEPLDSDRIKHELTAAQIRVSVRGGRIRVSPGVWSTTSDVDALASTVVQAWRR